MKIGTITTSCLAIIILLSLTQASQASIYKVKNAKQIALTFDDGPYPVFTEQILDVLKKEKIKATFFVVGKNIAKNPQLLQRISQEGHSIGNHTYNHSKITLLSNKKMLAELHKTNMLIKKITGQRAHLFRPPYGTSNKAKLKLIKQANYKVVLWSVNADDFYHQKSGIRKPGSIVKRVLARIKGGDIILMHDKTKEIVAALPQIITRLKKQGYTFVSLN